MIIEIISPSSVKMDRVIKFNKYEKAGVREYWIVEPDQKLASVFVLQDNLRYGRTELYTEDDKITVSKPDARYTFYLTTIFVTAIISVTNIVVILLN